MLEVALKCDICGCVYEAPDGGIALGCTDPGHAAQLARELVESAQADGWLERTLSTGEVAIVCDGCLDQWIVKRRSEKEADE